MLLAGAYSYNDRTARLDGQRGALMPDGALRNMGAYFGNFILEYRGWAFYTDFMGRSCDRPLFNEDPAAYVYTGQGLNIQTSYLFNRKWEIALRNSTLFRQRRFSPWQDTATATRRRWASPVTSSATV